MAFLASRRPMPLSTTAGHCGLRRTGISRRHSIGVLAASKEKRTNEARKAHVKTEPRKCPCGSGAQYQDCCGPIVAGAWARTAPELASARFTAVVMNNAQMLADTTHPEALAAIGTKQALLNKIQRQMRNLGVGERVPSLVDSVHGQDPSDPDNWIVLMAISQGLPGVEEVITFGDLFRKDNGRWWYMSSLNSYPYLDQFAEFMERYGGEVGQGDKGPWNGLYDFGYVPLPPRRLSATSAQRRAPWLADDWPADEQQQGWVYLDTAKHPGTGLTAAQMAAQVHETLSKSLRQPEMDWETYYFRFGRFFM